MNLLGEDLRLGPRTDLTERRPTQGVWKLHDWNAVRIRMIGEAPRVTLWLNDTLIWDVQGKYEVTQAQWTKVMGSNPSVSQGSRVKDDDGKHPVGSVTWEDAVVDVGWPAWHVGAGATLSRMR